MGRCIGIDLGETHATAAIFEAAGARVLRNREGAERTASSAWPMLPLLLPLRVRRRLNARRDM
jgi:molecular chaperone DnaK (HSP70)